MVWIEVQAIQQRLDVFYERGLKVGDVGARDSGQRRAVGDKLARRSQKGHCRHQPAQLQRRIHDFASAGSVLRLRNAVRRAQRGTVLADRCAIREHARGRDEHDCICHQGQRMFEVHAVALPFDVLHCLLFDVLHCLLFDVLHCLMFDMLHCLLFDMLHCLPR